MHGGLQVLSRLVYAERIKLLLPYASLLKSIADLLKWCGSDSGAMHVTLTGMDHCGQPLQRTWTLTATHGDGPFVPALAAAA